MRLRLLWFVVPVVVVAVVVAAVVLTSGGGEEEGEEAVGAAVEAEAAVEEVEEPDAAPEPVEEAEVEAPEVVEEEPAEDVEAEPSPCKNGIAVHDPAAKPGLVADCEILLTARDALAGSGTLNWDPNIPVSFWDGVYVNGASLRTLHVLDLHLEKLGLTGHIPAELGDLSALRDLWLHDNQLTGPIPAQLDALAKLVTLSLQDNRLTGPIPEALDALGSLENLWLNGNQLSDEVVWELTSFSSLMSSGDFTLARCLPPMLRHLYPPPSDAPYRYVPTCTPTEVCENGTVVANAAANPGLVDDCVALLTAETGLTGDEYPLWETRLNWNAATSIIAWDGVMVAGSPALGRAIDLESVGLTGRIEPQLSWLSALEELQLGDNALSGVIPASLGELPALERLSLIGNADFTGCIPPTLREVRDHDLDDVGLPDCPPPVPPSELCTNGTAVPRPADNPGLVEDCVALLTAEVTLAGSATLNWDPDIPITEWEGITIGGAPKRVQRLELGGRGLTGRVPVELGDLSELRFLDLSGNYLAGAIPGALGALANLEGLSLRGNRLSAGIPAELGSLRQLEHVSLAGNDLTGTIPVELGALRDLEYLSLGWNRLTGPIPRALGALGNLERLYLNSNRLSGTIPGELGSLHQLDHLQVDDNDLIGTVPEELGALGRLQYFFFFNTWVTGPLPEGLEVMWLWPAA